MMKPHVVKTVMRPREQEAHQGDIRNRFQVEAVYQEVSVQQVL